MSLLAGVLMVLVLVAGFLAQLVGLPGTWLIVLAAAGYAWWLPGEGRAAIGWSVVLVLALLAVLGEVVETLAGAAGVARMGGSRRGVVLAIVGSVIGSLVGVFVGVPIPVVGSLVAALVFGGLGALAGAFVGERWYGRDFDGSLEVGKAAFVGRLLGTAAKLIVCSIMMVVALAALIL